MPAYEDFNPDDLRDLWECCFVIRTDELAKSDCSYAFMGEFIVDSFEQGLIKGRSGNMISPTPIHSIPYFQTVVQSKKPLLDEGEFYNVNDELVKYRQCLLPFGKEGKVDAILGGMNFKIFIPDIIAVKDFDKTVPEKLDWR